MEKQFLSIAFGWLLGLLSSIIIEYAKSRRRKHEVVSALKVELEDLRFRLAVSSLQIAQTRGLLNQEFLVWIKPIVETYTGNEPHSSIRKAVESLATLDDQNLARLVKQVQVSDGVGLSLKTFHASFLETHLADISKMPLSTQRKIHEFRNHLNMLNQEIAKADDYQKMTFNKSFGDENIRRLHDEVNSKYVFVQERSKIAATFIGSILSEI